MSIATADLHPREIAPVPFFRFRFPHHLVSHPALGRKGILSVFRALIFLIILVLVFFNKNENQVVWNLKIDLFFGFYLLSIIGMFFLNPKWLDKKYFLPGIFMVDTVFITLGIYRSGMIDSDLFLVFFTTVFISAISQDVKSVFSVALVSCVLYGFLEYKSTGEFFNTDTNFLVRFPFLFVAAALSGFMAMDTKKHKDAHARLMNMNQFLAERADASTQKLIVMNQKLKSLLEYHHCVLSSLKTGVIVAQKDGHIRTFNAGARQITGCVEAEMAERTVDTLPEELAPIAAALKRTLETEKSFVQDHLDIKTTRSEMLPITLETSALRAGNGELLGAIATLKDVTLLRQMETQLVRSERFSALGEMAAGVAHEIKNPLNAIMGFSKRLSSKLQEPNLKKYAEIIAEEVVRMDAIVNDVLEYSRPDRVSKVPTDIHAMVDETIQFLNEKLEKGNIRIIKNYSSDMPLVAMDLPKIRQVVLNLVLNAVQAMPEGGTLTLSTGVVDGLVVQDHKQVEADQLFQQLFLQQKMGILTVQDTGCGISKENMSKLFHPFFTTKITGTGLGLSICHKIIASHGGTLDVQSEPGKGSRFSVSLPLEDA